MGFDRRLFLRAAGIQLALPAFESLGTQTHAANTATNSKRFVCIASNYGMYPQGFFPVETGSDYQLPSSLTSLEPHREQITIFSNLDHPGVGGGHGCSDTFLNGMELKSSKDTPQQLHTLDEFLGETIGRTNRFSNLRLGAGGFSWSRAGIKLPSEANPVSVYSRLFSEDTPRAKQQIRQFIVDDSSILDVVRQDANQLTRKLGKEDQSKLDQYLTAIREVERKLHRRNQWLDRPKPKINTNVIRGDDQSESIIDLAYPYNIAVMYDLMVLALQTNSTNVISFGHPGGNRLFPFDGISLGYHSLTHHGQRPEIIKELAIIETFYIKQLARFLQSLKDTPDSHGKPLLESTIVLFGSGMGNASTHSSRNLPIMLAGGNFRHGSHHQFQRAGYDGRPLSDLFVTILQRLGVEKEQFATSTGDLNELLI
ncbi:MAG: DUF1552 domain-containing protein [Pirellulales bacterium]|nr:DUF1552 domain-containing protein [Pirellulales bacterium]